MDIICNQESDSRKAIQYAIDALPGEGGRVIIPAGNWESEPIWLRSNTELYLEPGTEIWFFSDPLHSSPYYINLDHTSYVSILGRGVFHDGAKISEFPAVPAPTSSVSSGEKTAGTTKEASSYKAAAVKTRTLFSYGTAAAFIGINHADHLLLSDFRIEEGKRIAIYAQESHGIRIAQVRIKTGGAGIHGILANSCRNVDIHDCKLYTSGNGVMICANQAKPETCASTNIELRNCYFDQNRTAIEIEPGSTGGMEDINVRRCLIQQVDKGISIPARRDTGGYLRDCRFENIQICNASVAAIDFSTRGSEPGSRHESTQPTDFRNIELCNIYGERNRRDLAMETLTPRQRRGIRTENIALV